MSPSSSTTRTLGEPLIPWMVGRVARFSVEDTKSSHGQPEQHQEAGPQARARAPCPAVAASAETEAAPPELVWLRPLGLAAILPFVPLLRGGRGEGGGGVGGGPRLRPRGG